MAYTQADIDALRAKIAAFAGVRSTQFDGQSTSFSLDDALKQLALMEREVSGATKSYRVASTSKGV